ncbi:MAG: type II secretion system protein GspC [Cellvibrionaceae bacterium]
MSASQTFYQLPLEQIKRQAQKPWVIKGITIFLALLLAWQMGALVWKFVKGAETPPPPSNVTAAAPKANQQSALKFLISHPLMNAASEKGASPEITSAPKTSLNLKLVGLLYSADKKQARAIIENKRDGGKSYGIGAKIGGLAEVHAIHPDKVILKRSGRFETLPLEVKTTEIKVTRVESGINGVDSQVQVSRSTTRYLRSATRSPQDFMRQFTITPAHYSGHLLGYKLKALRKPQLMKELGLKPDDVIAAINGTTLTDPKKMMEMYEELKHSNELQLSIINNGQRRELNISLN